MEEVPSEKEAAFDLDMDIMGPGEMGSGEKWYHIKMRVRASDGALAVVFMYPIQGPAEGATAGSTPESPECGSNPGLASTKGNGPWWPICCLSQAAICKALDGILWWVDLGCDKCVKECLDGDKNNPCHSCVGLNLDFMPLVRSLLTRRLCHNTIF